MLGHAFGDVLGAARVGAAWAFERLYGDLAGVVTGYLRQQGADEPDDLASETFLQVFSSLDRFDGDEAGFRSWVFTIAHRRLIDERRRRTARPQTSELDAMAVEPATAADVTDGPTLDTLRTGPMRSSLAALTEAQRDVVLLRVVAGFSVAEVAELTGRRPAAVRQLQRRGLRAMAEALETEGVDGGPLTGRR